jgi:hypothetical protein
MATWIGHLRLAENLLARIGGLDAGQFALGNVAPDSGIPDKKHERFDPPVTVTHFQKPDSDLHECADLIFRRRYLAGLDPERDMLRFSFRLGYFFHLITDNLWALKIGRPTQTRFSEHFTADPKFIWTVKDDWYGLDFLYVRSHPECLFWRTFLGAEPVACDLDFLPIEAVNQQLAYMKEYYQRTDAGIEKMARGPFLYLSQKDMDRFVDETSDDLFGIYRLVWQDDIAPPAGGSALSLLA